ncbi:hypothetical protein ACFPES_15360 [Paenibacillus sp. GCM10023248]|uniref:hypothetical protein n=1 Tax=unclassified Paenibacillus TaxID=185978 RepID=UPI0023795370|nr:hypothetical protein [Paenibacillus sp. MAHUQ-63]MDD9268418.1 hypothetical protein [Paenibacillus sp. MAHUQ-63]
MNRHADLSSRVSKNNSEEGSRNVPDFRSLNQAGAAQLSKLHATIGNRAVGQLVQRTFAATGTSIQRMTDEDKQGKPNKQKLEKSRKKYEQLAKQFPKDSAIESFDYLFENATDYDDLNRRIDAEIDKADRRSKAVEAQRNKLKEEEKAALVQKPLPEPVNSPTTSAEPTKKKKKTKIDITADVISSPTMKQESVTNSKKATNVMLQNWINTGKPAKASIEQTGEMKITDETVYIYATIIIPDKDDPVVINKYPIEVHYHPVNSSKNYLHVKHSAGSSPKNKITETSWLIPSGASTLKSAVELWNETFPDNISTHKW